MSLPRPQRIFSPSPIGSLLKRATVPTTTARTSHHGDADHLALVRQCPCLKCGLDPCGVAAHLRMNSGAYNKRQAMGRKPSEKWTTPLCAGCHTNDPDAQHRMGEAMFWAALRLNPFQVCERLYSQSGDLVAMRAVIFNAIAQRGK